MEAMSKIELLKEVKKRLNHRYKDKEETPITIESVCDTYMEVVFDNLKQQTSIKYEAYPIWKAKKGNPNYHEDSPRAPKKKSVMVSIRIPLEAEKQ